MVRRSDAKYGNMLYFFCDNSSNLIVHERESQFILFLLLMRFVQKRDPLNIKSNSPFNTISNNKEAHWYEDKTVWSIACRH